MPHDEHVLIKKFGKDPDPAKLSPMDEWSYRNDYTDQVTDRAVRKVRKAQERSHYTFSMPRISQKEWDRIFKKGKK